jgi:signal transduction histidine kinase/ActR/RegA family two-component response regulator
MNWGCSATKPETPPTMNDRNGLWHSQLSPSVVDELLGYLSRQALNVAFGVTLVTVVVLFFARAAPLWMSIGWAFTVAVVAVARIFVLRALPHRPASASPSRLNIVVALAALNGLAHGLCIFFWPFLTDLQKAMQTLIVTGLCTTSIVSGLGYMRAYVAYLVPTMGPTAAAWMLVVGGSGEPGSTGDAVAVFARFAGTAAFLLLLARDTFRRFLDAHHSRERLRQALEVAEHANRAKTRFLASASHDLRQPMHTLSLFAAALTMRPLDNASREIARHIDTALQALSSQLDALLDVSKLDAGIVAVRASEFSAVQLLGRLVSEFEPAARRKGLRLDLEAPAEANVLSDPMLLERVLRNLVDNAIKYTPSGSIDLTIDADHDHWIVRVRDTGTGIPASEQKRVFEEFYQVGNPERDRTQGLGLGLSIVKRLGELLALDLSMRSTVGVGTVFEMRLPAVGLVCGPPASSAAATSNLRGLSVLVVDDEEGVRLAMQTLFQGLGCQCSAVAGRETALEAARESRPDIVLADLRLRGNDDGIAVVHALRELHPDIPALLVSGDTAPERLRDAHVAALRLLHKPVPVDVLTKTIREEVDRGKRRVYGGGRED